jgi:hypothetical protein
MLDKTAEKVLKYLIIKSNHSIDTAIIVNNEFVDVINISADVFYAACEYLLETGYLKTFHTYYDSGACIILNYRGYSYFEYKKLENKLFYKNFALSKISDIIIAFITTIITAVNIETLISFFKELCNK